MKTSLALARKEAVARLLKTGINDPFIVKLRRVEGKALGLYRNKSQFRGRPIFWINDSIPLWDGAEPVDLVRGMTITILHEYGHVIWEYLSIRTTWTGSQAQKLWEDLRALSTGSEAEDEEDFAESFAQNLYWGRQGPTTDIGRRFGTLLKGIKPCR